MPTPADYSSQETQRDVYSLDSGEPLFRQKLFEPNQGKKPAVTSGPRTMPKPPQPDLPSPFFEASNESYLKARRVAEMKFNTVKLLIAHGIISTTLIVLDLFFDPETWWCYWPIALWSLVLTFPVLKSFVFRGKDLRTVIEARIHRMALREVERYDGEI